MQVFRRKRVEPELISQSGSNLSSEHSVLHLEPAPVTTTFVHHATPTKRILTPVTPIKRVMTNSEGKLSENTDQPT